MVFRIIKSKVFKRIVLAGTVIFALILALITVSNIIVNNQSPLTYNSTQKIPQNKVGLLLGTAKYLSKGTPNLYYKYRIEAAIELYRSGKIKYILISGDHGTISYNEPTTMKKDLVEKGIPASKIYLDYAGFRTLDSVVRCKKVFGQENITIISQQFHNKRAIYLARQYGMKAVGYNAKDVSARYGFKTQVREKLARTKMVLDLIFGTDPKYLGKKIEIK